MSPAAALPPAAAPTAPASSEAEPTPAGAGFADALAKATPPAATGKPPVGQAPAPNLPLAALPTEPGTVPPLLAEPDPIGPAEAASPPETNEPSSNAEDTAEVDMELVHLSPGVSLPQPASTQPPRGEFAEANSLPAEVSIDALGAPAPGPDSAPFNPPAASPATAQPSSPPVPPPPAAPVASPAPIAPPQPRAPALVHARPGVAGTELGLEIARAGREGQDELVIRLDPAELGQVEVRLHWEDGTLLRATVRAEQPAALDLFRREVADLGRALSEAGVRADSGQFRFEGGGDGRHARTWSAAQRGRQADADEALPPVPLPTVRLTPGRVHLLA